MKKWYRYLAAGVLVLLTLCVAGCGGVSHKSPEKVTEELIQSYTDGKEKKVKECYNQADKLKGSPNYSASEMLLDVKMHKAISVIQFKVEGQIIKKNPGYEDKISEKAGV